MIHKLSRRLVMVVGVVLAFAGPAVADSRDGRAVYERGDKSTASQQARRLAAQKDARAQFALANIYRHGDGRERGQAESPFGLEGRQTYSPGTPTDHVESVERHRRAAENDHIPAQFQLGYMYDTGLGVAPNRLEAEKWYRSAAVRGDGWAQYRLALLYMTGGYGLAQDHGKALQWLEITLDHGNPLALAYLARKCFRAMDARADREEALTWCRIAAERGDSEGQFALGIVLSEVEGWPVDLVEAHMWFEVAARVKHPFAREKYDRLADRMTAAEIGEAQQLARSWTSKNERHSKD